MKTCPTCGASVAALITKLATNERICHNCIEDKTHPAAVVSQKIHDHTVAGTLMLEANRGLPALPVNYVRVVASDSSVHDVPAGNVHLALEIDNGLRTIPGPDTNVLHLSAEDVVFLWSCKIAA